MLLPRGAWLGFGTQTAARSRHASYLLVNDGTGRVGVVDPGSDQTAFVRVAADFGAPRRR